eukprot:438339-Rhodomonas_salina.1
MPLMLITEALLSSSTLTLSPSSRWMRAAIESGSSDSFFTPAPAADPGRLSGAWCWCWCGCGGPPVCPCFPDGGLFALCCPAPPAAHPAHLRQHTTHNTQHTPPVQDKDATREGSADLRRGTAQRGAPRACRRRRLRQHSCRRCPAAGGPARARACGRRPPARAGPQARPRGGGAGAA